MKASKPASSRQIGYIERLRAENGLTGPAIDNQTLKITQRLLATQDGEINEIWLSLAMKECFHLWTGLGRDIYYEHRESFVERAIETYLLFTTVAERLNGKIYEDRRRLPDL